jgi:hypothetical protein
MAKGAVVVPSICPAVARGAARCASQVLGSQADARRAVRCLSQVFSRGANAVASLCAAGTRSWRP